MIDILLATYNSENFLTQLLDSLLTQSFTDWQLLCRDDGSTDKTKQIIENYSTKDDRIRLIETDGQRLGAMKSFYQLMTISDSEYLMFCDHDDIWLPKKIEHAFMSMQQTEIQVGKDKPLLVFSDLQVTDQHLNIIDSSFWHYTNLQPQLLTDFASLAGVNCVTGCTMLINKAAKQAALPLGRHALMHDHYIALAVLANGGELILNHHSDILYRQHTDNVLGAFKRIEGKQLIVHRLTHLKEIFLQNCNHIRQARDIAPLSIKDYVCNKWRYKKQLKHYTND